MLVYNNMECTTNEEVGGESNLFDKLQSARYYDDDDEHFATTKSTSTFDANSYLTVDECAVEEVVVNAEDVFTFVPEDSTLCHAEDVDETEHQNSGSNVNESENSACSATFPVSIKAELMDEEEGECEEYPNTSTFNAYMVNCDATPTQKTQTVSVVSEEAPMFELVRLTKQKATESVETVQDTFRKPDLRFKAYRQMRSTEAYQRLRDSRSRSRMSHVQDETSTAKPIFRRKRRPNKRKKSGEKSNEFSFSSDITCIDQVLSTWEAKTELQMACGYGASENLGVDLVIKEAINRIESLRDQQRLVKKASESLLQKQMQLVQRLLGGKSVEVPLAKKKRIRAKYAQGIASGQLLPPRGYM